MFKRQFVVVVLLMLWVTLTGQVHTVVISVDNQPLNGVLLQLRNRYGMELSFDNNLLSQFKVQLHRTFRSPEDALRELLKPFPLTYAKVGQTFVILKKKTASQTANKKKYVLSGYIVDGKTGEPLAFSHILNSEKSTASDVKGYFSELVSRDTSYGIAVSHLGYYVLDTTLLPGKLYILRLTPSALPLQEVRITGQTIDFSSQVGRAPGILRLNSKIATHLPGFGDNAVFNLLRLQPGILASGEQTNSLMIWGSYAGQSKVIFDGFTVYNLRNFNDNISAFNPFMAKDIEVMKGGYDARFGDRVGGIVNISGITGNPREFSFVCNINNMTLNTLLNIPVSKRSALVVAFRHTYFNLYHPADYTLRRNDSSYRPAAVSIHVVPDYVFRDMNIKYSGLAGKNDRYYLSLYGSNDVFRYNINQPIQFRQILKNTREENTQTGGSFFYGKHWKKGISSNFTAAFSFLEKDYDNDYRIEKLWNRNVDTLDKTRSENRLGEITLKVENRIPVTTRQTFELGGGWIANNSQLRVDTFDVRKSDMDAVSERGYFYFQDILSAGKFFSIKLGGRVTYALQLKKVYPEPRISIVFHPSRTWSFSLAWGIYNQFVSLTSAVDRQGNYHYLWAVSDNSEIPVLQSVHSVMAIRFSRKGYLVSLEAYYKTVEGLSRYFRFRDIVVPAIYHGNGRSYGIDFLFKKNFKGSSFWLAYSLSRTEEHFEYFPKRWSYYRRAPQDQRHELKAGVMVDLHPFYLSANYVYGSGFPITYNRNQKIEKDYPYSRLDAAAAWRFLNRKLKGETGLSVLNVLNTKNIKFSNFERIPLSQTSVVNLYAGAIPLTPTLYLKFSF